MGIVRDILFISFIIVAAILYFTLDEENQKNVANGTLGGIVGGIIGFIIGRV